MAILVPDDKLDHFGSLRKKICFGQNGLAFYLGPVLLPRADGSPFSSKEMHSYDSSELTVSPLSDKVENTYFVDVKQSAYHVFVI